MICAALALLLGNEVNDLDFLVSRGLLATVSSLLSCRASSVNCIIDILYFEGVFFRCLWCFPLHYHVTLWALLRDELLAFPLSEFAIPNDLWLPKLFVTLILTHSFVYLKVSVA